MLKFRQWLDESDDYKGEHQARRAEKKVLKEAWKLEKFQSKYGNSAPRILSHNHQKIDGHEIDLTINGSSGGHFVADYMVNGSFNRQKMDSKTGKKILHHVGRSIDSFVRHVKPTSISFTSDKDKKISLHKALSNRLARKYGGTAKVEYSQSSAGDRHTVIFKGKK